ncbi:MAG: hypothetical protein ABI551_11580 [Polyangiaceae bacterium]
MQKGHAALRTLLFTAAVAPLLTLTACDLLKHEPPATVDAGTASNTAPTTTETPAATTAAPIETTAPLAPVATAPNTKPKVIKLSDGGAAAQVTLTDGGTAILPAAHDGGVPGLPGFTIPTAFPSGMPTTIPTTLPSGFPTTLPSGFHLPTFPAPSASH